jgi:hypothetical protein
MKTALALSALLACGQLTAQSTAVHQIRPSDNPQAALDKASRGNRLVFLPGKHEHRPGKYRSLLYSDKSVDIELQAGEDRWQGRC